MKASIYDLMFPDVAPMEIPDVKHVEYICNILVIAYEGSDRKYHTYSINMDSTQYKRKVVFE